MYCANRRIHGGGAPPVCHDAKYARDALSVLQECRASGQALRANPRHTTCTDACRLWMCPSRPACVCLDSMNVHLCGERCDLPARLSMDNDGHVCPLTHISLPGAIYQQRPTFDAAGRPQMHWSLERKRKPRPLRGTRKPSSWRRSCTQMMVEKILLSCYAAGKKARSGRIQKNCVLIGAMTRKFPRPSNFLSAAAAVHRRVVVQPHLSSGEVRTLAACILRFLAKHTALSMSSAEVAVCTLLTLMRTGYSSGGMDLVEHVPSVCAWMPMPNEMAMVPKVNCRSMSTGVRSFKDYVLGDTGMPAYNKCLVLTPHDREQILISSYLGS